MVKGMIGRTSRAVIYRRVSSKRQAVSGASLEQQEEACRAHAERQGWPVDEVYTEAGKSAYTEDLNRRPAFQRLIADARARRFDIVLVYELSRFGRRRRAFAVGEELEKMGIRLVSATEQFDVDTVEGFVTYSILAMQAELHSRLLARRMTSIRAREAAAGLMAKRAPLGQRWEGKQLVWDERESALPRRAFALAAEGVGTDRLLLQLRAEGHAISRSSLHYILTNPAYIGLQEHRGTLLPASWPALVEREVWDQVQALRAARRPDNAVRATVRSHHDTLLAGLLRCANCGAKLHYDHHEGKRCYYHCIGRKNGGHCDARASRADKLDHQIAVMVQHIEVSQIVLSRAEELIESFSPEPPAQPGSDLREALRRLGRVYADGAISDEEYDRRRQALLAQIQAQENIAPPARLDRRRALALAADFHQVWESAGSSRRRELLSHLFTHVYVRRHTVYAVRPTELAQPWLKAVWEYRATSQWWPQHGYRPVVLLAA